MPKRLSPCPPLGSLVADGSIDVGREALIASQLAQGPGTEGYQLALKRLRSILGHDPTTEDFLILDIDGDKAVTLNDARLYSQFCAGLITTFPTCGVVPAPPSPPEPPRPGTLPLPGETSNLWLIAGLIVFALIIVLALTL